MAEFVGHFKRNGRQWAFLYTIRYAAPRFLIYAVDTLYRVETRMTYNRPTAQTRVRYSLAVATSTSSCPRGPGPPIGDVT